MLSNKKQRLLSNSSQYKKQNNTKNLLINRKTKKNKNNTKKTKKNQKGGLHQIKIIKQKDTYVSYISNVDEVDKYKYHSLSLPKMSCALLQWLVDKNNIIYKKKLKRSESVNWRKKEYDDNTYLGFKDFPAFVEKINDNHEHLNLELKKGGKYTLIEEGNLPLLSRVKNLENLKEGKFIFDVIDMNARNTTHNTTTHNNTRNTTTPNNAPNNDPNTIRIEQDISWVNKLIDNLKKKKKGETIEECDLLFSMYNIHQEMDIPNVDKADKKDKVVIIGYLDSRVSSIYTDEQLMKDLMNNTNTNSVWSKHKTKYNEYLVGLYNAFLEPGKQISMEDYWKLIAQKIPTGEKYIEALLKDKFFGVLKLEKEIKELEENLQAIENTGIQKNNNLNKIFENYEREIKEKKEKLREQNEQVQEKMRILKTAIKERLRIQATNLFTRPNFIIPYFFIPFIEVEKDGEITYEPLVYSVRELRPEHQPVLIEILRLIRTKIPEKFGILFPGETEYKNFYSYYRYSDFFYINTAYIHPVLNLDLKAHIYHRSITLEELIYSCGIQGINKRPFWEQVKFQYQISNHRIPLSLNESVSISLEKQKFYKPDAYNTYEQGDISYLIGAIIIICNILDSGITEIYYMKDGKYYYTKLKPKLDCLDYLQIPPIKIPISSQKNSISSKKKIYSCNGLDIFNIYGDFIVYEMEKPIEISTGLDEKMLKKLNLFKITWSFPSMYYTINNINYDFVNKTLGLDIDKYYPYSVNNILLAYKKKIQSYDPQEIDSKKCRFGINIIPYYESFTIDNFLIIIMYEKKKKR